MRHGWTTIATVVSLLVTGHATAQDTRRAEAGVAELEARAAAGESAAQFELGWKFHEADGVAEDFDLAATWLRRAADQDHPQAQVRLGNLYEWGHGVPEDAATAVSWYRRAAQAGLPQAQFALGLAYRRGYGVEAEAASAVEWFRRAAAGGFPLGAFALGELYRRGEGVPRDDVEAYSWLVTASSHANVPPFARVARDELRRSLTADQVAEGERRAMSRAADRAFR